MKLLFDANLSHKLVSKFADLFPESTHPRILGNVRSMDIDLWEYSKKNDFTIVTQDEVFFTLSLLKGSPPKVILLKIGNSSTKDVENLLRKNIDNIFSLKENLKINCLILH